MKQNILMIVVDQWRGDCLSILEHPTVKTPFLDALASEGILFDACYAQAPSCIPARACLATGKSPYGCRRIGYQDKVPWQYEKTLMHGFRDAGYQTINVGKTHFYPQRAHLGFEINALYDPQKLDSTFVSDYHMWLDRETKGRVKDPAITWDNNSWVVLPWQGEDEYHPSQWTVTEGQEQLEKRDPTRPFFMQLSFHRPHPPYDAPDFYRELYAKDVLPDIPVGHWVKEDTNKMISINGAEGRLDNKELDAMRKAYYASITHVDYMIGRMIYWLKQNGLYQNTTIVFVSDHGELLGDHYMYRKVNPFEGSSRIPLIIKPAKQVENTMGEKRCHVPCSHYDLLPTLYSLVNIPVPEEVEGIDLFRSEPRKYIHGEHTGYGQEGWQFLTNGQWKYIYETSSGREWYFDLNQDPQELVNCIQEKEDEYREEIDYCRKNLVACLENRPEYMCVKNGKLTPCQRMPDYLE